MSRSFTTRPTATTTRGRGRGTRQSTYTQRASQEIESEQYGAEPSDPYTTGATGYGVARGRGDIMNGQADTGRITYQGGYSVIPPDEQKRQKVTEMARREEENYAAHKQKHTPKTVSYVGTAGGGQMTQQEARQRQIQNSPTKTQRLLQNEGRKMTIKQREEEELQRKKDEQRKKSLLNEQRQKQAEEEAQHRWDEQRRRTNDAFLNRLERKTNRPPGNNGPERVLQGRSLPAARTSQGAVSRDQNMATGVLHGLTTDQRKKVDALAVLFPHYTHTELIEMLKLTDFSLDAAVEMMQ